MEVNNITPSMNGGKQSYPNFKKVSFYIAQYPVHWTVQSALHFTPGGHVYSDTNSASLGSILAKQQLRTNTNHSHFYHSLSVNWGVMERTKMPKLRKWWLKVCFVHPDDAQGIDDYGDGHHIP